MRYNIFLNGKYDEFINLLNNLKFSSTLDFVWKIYLRLRHCQ